MDLKLPLTLFSYFFLTFSLFAQTVITGTIKDIVTTDPLPGATVTIDGKPGTAADINGIFTLNVEPGTHQLLFHMIGFKDIKQQVEAKEGEKITLDVNMESEAQSFDIVVVSAGKYEQKIGDVTVSVEVIKPELVENKNTTNMETILDQVPGVNVTDGQANIRGGSGYSYGAGSRVLLLVDDLPQLSGDAGDVKWNFLPCENVEQVEVIKGASSALYGSSALNGVIHFRTRYPRDTPETKFSIYSGFYDNPKRAELIWWKNRNPAFSGANFLHARKCGNLDLVMGGHVFTDDGYRELETEQRARFNMNTRYRFKKVPGLSAGVNLNSMYTQGGLFIVWLDGDTGAYRPSGGEVQNYKNFRFTVDPFVTYFGAKGHKHSLRTRYYRTDNRNDTEQSSEADFWYGEYQYQKQFESKLTITSGYVLNYTVVTSALYLDHYAANMSAYGQFDKKFFDKLNVSFGIRGEYYKLDTASTEFNIVRGENDTITLPFRPVARIGVSFEAAKATWLRASYGQGYRFPSIAEKYIRTSASGLEIYPNDSLQPETGQSAEFGIKQGIKCGKWMAYLDLSAFWMEYHNMMEFSFNQWGNPLVDPFFGLGFRSINVGSTRTRGIDVSLIGQGKIGKIGTNMLLGYTYMDPQSLIFNIAKDSLVNTSKENILKYRYRHIAKADVEISWRKFMFGTSMRFNTFMENIDRFFYDASFLLGGIKEYRERFNSSDWIFDMRFSYQVNKTVRVALVTNNITNHEYSSRPADVQPPRNFTLQVSMKF
ncbi:MAG: iron complex outermembrane recepter protein [Bacteroidetes bacterium]|nr:MAG: iron complex outermembrane recepter protein [Bacteroidota bacterium]